MLLAASLIGGYPPPVKEIVHLLEHHATLAAVVAMYALTLRTLRHWRVG